jgi:type II secretory pathway pseudopilin PulG
MQRLSLNLKKTNDRARPVSEGGFGLIEVLLSIALLGSIGVALLSGLSTAMNSNIVAERNLAGINLAQSQVENLSAQEYRYAPSTGIPDDDIAFYDRIITVPGGDLVGTAPRGGNPDGTGESIECTTGVNGGPIGIPWNTLSGQAESTDAGLQKIRLVIKQGSDWATGTIAYTIDIYKVK